MTTERWCPCEAHKHVWKRLPTFALRYYCVSCGARGYHETLTRHSEQFQWPSGKLGKKKIIPYVCRRCKGPTDRHALCQNCRCSTCNDGFGKTCGSCRKAERQRVKMEKAKAAIRAAREQQQQSKH